MALVALTLYSCEGKGGMVLYSLGEADKIFSSGRMATVIPGARTENVEQSNQKLALLKHVDNTCIAVSPRVLLTKVIGISQVSLQHEAWGVRVVIIFPLLAAE